MSVDIIDAVAIATVAVIGAITTLTIAILKYKSGKKKD